MNTGSETNTESVASRRKLLEHLYELVGPQAVFLPVPYGEKGPRFENWQKTTFEQTLTIKYREQLSTALARATALTEPSV
jgi:hypothetical protein